MGGRVIDKPPENEQTAGNLEKWSSWNLLEDSKLEKKRKNIHFGGFV